MKVKDILKNHTSKHIRVEFTSVSKCGEVRLLDILVKVSDYGERLFIRNNLNTKSMGIDVNKSESIDDLLERIGKRFFAFTKE